MFYNYVKKDLFIGDTLLHKGYHDVDALSIYAFASLPEMLLLEKSGATFLEMKFRNRISESGFFRGTDAQLIWHFWHWVLDLLRLSKHLCP